MEIPCAEEMAIRNEDWPKIDERIDDALAGVRSDIKALRPQGWRAVIFWLREAGIFGVVIAAFVTMLGITATAIYRAVADVSEEAHFRNHTDDPCHGQSSSLHQFQTAPGCADWIPAFAGMTFEARESPN